jgi:glycosidase
LSREFHIARKARDKYKFDDSLFTLSGNVIFANFHASRVFAQKINDKRDLIRFPESAVRAGQINAMGLIDEILHYVVQLYQEEENPDAMTDAMEWLKNEYGEKEVEALLRLFCDQFPPLAVYKGEVELEEYLSGETDGVANSTIELEEMLMLWLENMNPAFSPYIELFDDIELEKRTRYKEIIDGLGKYFASQKPFGPDLQDLVQMLRSPAIAVPHSLTGQLEYIRERWASLLGKYLYRLLGSLDLIREEEKMRFLGPGPTRILDYKEGDLEFERYSMDRDWMPRTVLLAKSTYVWLDQLSKKYQQPIKRLDQIPDEELDAIARWGFTGLWLIGLWERSRASQRIKQMCGNPEAVASAYSLFDYQIADDLGGESAFNSLKQRAWERGIRMAGDMVPNHVGIDGKWVVEHPDWFVSLDYSPYPSYSFNGTNLSWDDRVGIYLEDHYYSREDAAVVFKRVDHWTGSEKYVYHGNDGTSMPWNDTAQLNYLNPDVREAVIQTILEVARRFPIIRFDAAMTLTKRHFQRLWFPQPGTGGDIPTRAEHGLSKEDFNSAFPEEFWREVVDRVAQEVPDTLLLAEAFWLMEGYFVRTLGMHRVYNSAFMNMLKMEENAKYRASIRNVLEFDPEILKRFVNFMNNPDEETAIAQFGKEDKYFGVCMLMVTMPGLPMFGHGQVEGFTEKYGMEYRRSYWDETPDEHLIRRHEREIFPLMHRRYLFAEVRNFLLYDFYTPEGHVNENVFAYSNRAGDERGLVIYNNRFENTNGWVKTSAAYAMKTNGDDRQLTQRGLGEGLGLRNDPGYYTIFRDHRSGLEFIRNSSDIHDKGVYVELSGYQYHVFLDFREVQDNEWHHYGNLARYLDGRGVPNIEEALKETFLQPIHYPFKEIVNVGSMRYLIDNRATAKRKSIKSDVLDEAKDKCMHLLKEIGEFSGGTGTGEAVARSMRDELNHVLRFAQYLTTFDAKKSAKLIKSLTDMLAADSQSWYTLLGWWCVHALGRVVSVTESPDISRSWIDEWLFGKVLANAFQDAGMDESYSWEQIDIIKICTTHQRWFERLQTEKGKSLYPFVKDLLEDSDVRRFIQVNRHQDVLWFNRERVDSLLRWLAITALVRSVSVSTVTKAQQKKESMAIIDTILKLGKAKEKSEYRVENLLKMI